ncbi:MAG: RNA polymerase sigma-70 factor (ECF subfamily) [Halioglobus sp.]
MNKILDIHYLDKVLNGDKDSFRYFIKEYQEMGYSIAISILKNKQDSEDAVQNGFIQAFKSLRSFKREAKFSSWLYRIIVNESLKQVSKNKKETNRQSNIIIDPESSNTENIAVSNLSKKERRTMINGVLIRMKPKESLALKLHYLHELTIKEIQETTGFSINNIKILLYRGRRSFKQITESLNNEF